MPGAARLIEYEPGVGVGVPLRHTTGGQAAYGQGWTQGLDGLWTPLATARFTGDRNPVLNIDAGRRGDRFFLATGGTTRNAGLPLGESLTLPPEAFRLRPDDLPADRLGPRN